MALNYVIRMCVGILLMIPASLYAEEVLPQLEGASTSQKDGYLGKVKSVKYYNTTVDNATNTLVKGNLSCYFAYDSLGRRVESYDTQRHMLYKNGYDIRGNRVRSYVLCDSLKERMRDTLFVYSREGKLQEKRISSWGELIETESYEYDSTGKLTVRKLFSESGERTLKMEEKYRYDKLGRLSTHEVRDQYRKILSKEILKYNAKSGLLERKREESNGVCLHSYFYSYDSLGHMTKKLDESKIGGRIARIEYLYDSEGQLRRERLYDVDSVWLGDRKYWYYSKGNLRREEVLNMKLAPYDDTTMVNEWDLKVMTYNKKGGTLKESFHYVGRGDWYGYYDDMTYMVLPDQTLLAVNTDEYFEYIEYHNVSMCPAITRRQLFYTDVALPMDYTFYRYDRHGNCTRVETVDHGPLDSRKYVQTKYKGKDKPVQSLSFYGSGFEKSEWKYDDHGNRVRWMHSNKDGKNLLYGTICEFEYWK